MDHGYLVTDDELAQLRGHFDVMEAAASRWAAADEPSAEAAQEIIEIVRQMRQVIDRAEAGYNGEA